MGHIVVGTWWADESGGVPGTALLRDVKPALSSNGHNSPGTPTSSTAICRTGARPSPPGFPSAAPQGENPSASIGPHLGLAGPVSPSGPQHPAGAPTGEGDLLRVLPPAWPEDSQRPPKAVSGLLVRLCPV